MDPILGLMFFLACWEGTKHFFAHARDARRTSRGAHVRQAREEAGGTLPLATARRAARQHDTAWWASETAHGFPVHRTGWHSSWLAHKTAVDHHRARREEARTTHLDTRASILASIPEHKRRQAEAQALIDKALEEAGQQAGGKRAVRDVGDELARKRAGKTGVPPLPAGGIQPTRRVDGQPETESDKRFFDHRESGYTGPLDRDGNIPDAADPRNARVLDALASLGTQGANGSQKAVPETASSPPATEGTPPMATEANYTESLRVAKELEQAADEEVNDTRRQKMGNLIDQLGALLRGNPKSLSEAAEVADALKEQQKAAERTRDAAAAFAEALQRDYGALKEAADDSPAAVPEPEFLED